MKNIFTYVYNHLNNLLYKNSGILFSSSHYSEIPQFIYSLTKLKKLYVDHTFFVFIIYIYMF